MIEPESPSNEKFRSTRPFLKFTRFDAEPENCRQLAEKVYVPSARAATAIDASKRTRGCCKRRCGGIKVEIVFRVFVSVRKGRALSHALTNISVIQPRR